jgi:hypothetical protein
MQGVPLDEARLILCENALRLYGLTSADVGGRTELISAAR